MTLQRMIQEFMLLEYSAQITAIILAAFIVLTILLRVVLTMWYQGYLSTFRWSRKEIKKKEDLVPTHSFLLNRIMKDYKAAGEKGLASINSTAIIKKHMLKLHFIGWGLSSMDIFLQGIEKSILFCGISVSIWMYFYTQYLTGGVWLGGITAIAFVLQQLLPSIFDYRSVREKLSIEMQEYIDHQYAPFYTQDLGSAVLTFRQEMQHTLLTVAKTVKESTEKLGSELAHVLVQGTGEMTKTVHSAMEKLATAGSAFEEPLQQWKDTTEQGRQIFEQLTITMRSFQGSIQGFESAAGTLEAQLKAHEKQVREDGTQKQQQGTQLQTIIEGAAEGLKSVELQNKAVEKQLQLVENHQNVLNTSLQQYEEVLQRMTKEMGDAFGHMAAFHGQKAGELMASQIKEVITHWEKKNEEMIHELTHTMEQSSKQAHSTSTMIVHMKDQVDLSFDRINEQLQSLQKL